MTSDDEATGVAGDAIVVGEQSSRTVPASSVKILMDDGISFCTGVLVNESYAVTERHCASMSIPFVEDLEGRGCRRRYSRRDASREAASSTAPPPWPSSSSSSLCASDRTRA